MGRLALRGERITPFSLSRPPRAPARRVLASAYAARTAPLRREGRGVQASRLCHPETPMKSSMGRPRLLTDDQVDLILAWRADVAAWKEQGRRLKTRKQLAKELGVSEATIWNVLEHQGQFKQADPEQRSKALRDRRRQMQRLRRAGFL